MKIRIAYIETDSIYAARFLNAFCTYYSDKVELHTFSDSTNFINLNDRKKYDVVLLCDRIDSDILEFLSDEVIIYMTSSPLCVSEDVPEINKISKFQNISTIYNEILNYLSEKYTILKTNHSNVSPAKVISFLSYDSSSGTSTLASSFALKLAENKKTLYLDLQTYPTLYQIFQGDGNLDLSDIIYHIKSDKSNLIQRINHVVRVDKSGVFFIPPCSNSLEQSELTKDNIAKIIDELKENGDYDVIIIDYNQIFSEFGKHILDISDNIVFAKTDSSTCRLKFDYMLHTLKLLQNKLNTDYISKSVILNNRIRNKTIIENQFDSKNADLMELGCIDEYIGLSNEGLINLLKNNKFISTLYDRCVLW